jgi:SAM-dependent methyltransferase
MRQTECRVCGSKELEIVLDLGNQPWCNDYKRENEGSTEKYPLRACFCHSCTTFQIDENVSPEVMYGNHTYRSASNKSMHRHFDDIALTACKYFKSSEGLVVDIGSNDGTLLQSYKKLNWNVLGVEPSKNTAEAASASGIETICEYFCYETSEAIRNKYANSRVDIISAANVLYHIENVHGVLAGVSNLLDKQGVFVIQATYLPRMIEANEFDIIYHEHLLYYRLETLDLLLKMHGLEVFECELSDVHGGSMIVFASHIGERLISENVRVLVQQERNGGFDNIGIYQEFAARVSEIITRLRELINRLVSEGSIIYAYGAPAKGTVLINALGMSVKQIKLAVEVNEQKIGTFIPATDIPVVYEYELEIREPDYYLLLSWNFLDVFMQSTEYMTGKRKFIVPFPYPRIQSNCQDHA